MTEGAIGMVSFILLPDRLSFVKLYTEAMVFLAHCLFYFDFRMQSCIIKVYF